VTNPLGLPTEAGSQNYPFGQTDNSTDKKRHILVVEEMDNASFMETILSHCGVELSTHCANEKDALSTLKDNIKNGLCHVDLLIIDFQTSNLDGWNFCQTLSRNPAFSAIPILVIASRVEWQDDMVNTCLKAGANDVIFKPLQKPDLLPRLNTLLMLKHERDKNKENADSLECELADKKIMEARLKYMVNHDDLTGLTNRRRLEQAIEVALLQSELNGKKSALIYLDLDQFKVINDIEGHTAGDQLLIDVANLLRKRCASHTTVSRISSDEFTVLLEGADEVEALTLSESIRTDLECLNFSINDREYHIGASIGITLIQPHEKITASEALARSDQACYEAKKKGRNRIHIYNQEDTNFNSLRDDAYWVPQIRNALSNSLFVFVFQPVMDIATGAIDRYEALIRMKGDDEQLIAPNNFIPVAERMGLIHDIDLWVVTQAFNSLQALPEKQNNISLNINLSSHAFQSTALLPLVKNRIETTGIDANRITFEITETAAVANYEKTRAMVEDLKKLGCSIALDDFGSGFNSFNHLKQLPIDYIKIDGGFITNLVNDPIDQTFVRSITEIARSLNKKTVAEFVVSQEIMDLLVEYGVDYAQGYYIGKPDVDFLD